MNNIHIVIALDERYWHKAVEYGLFDSIKKHTSNNKHIYVKCFCFGFDVPSGDKNFLHHRWSWAKCEKNELKSFREGYPRNQKNRTDFICGEGGEFLDHFKFDSNDVIVHIDADITMQREFHEWELRSILSLKYGEVGGTYHSEPSFSLETESSSLRMQETVVQAKKHFPNHWEKPVFCTGVVVATVQTYRDIIQKQYIPLIDKMVMLFDHHAIGQWLMNQVVYEYGNFYNLGRIFHNANWFVGSKQNTEDVENQLHYKGDLVLFNHHKFNKKWSF